MTAPFVIYALPRSRTFWLSRFLSYGGWTCGHDEIRHVRSLEDVRTWLNLPATGTVETAGAPWWRIVQEMRPDTRTVVVRRPVDEVVHSLLTTTGQAFDEAALRMQVRHLDAKLDQIEARVPGALSVRFADLADEATCATVFEHCLSAKHDPAWWQALAPIKLEINFQAEMRYYQAHAAQLARVGNSAKQQILAGMARWPVMSDAVTFQREPLDVVLRDGKRLFAEHLVQIGEPPDAYDTKNLPLMQALDKLGALHVTTARSNGRMLGYLMAIVSPSLEHENKREALHTAFFVSRDAPGVGLKLQRASIEGLRARGVDQVFMRAGVRGSGPRMGALYKRLGAATYGEMFSLELQEAS